MPFERLIDESRLFLSRWYLLEWQTPEERMMDIAKHAEKILWIKWFADKFYNYLWKGYYSLSTPVRTNFWNWRWMPISCHSIEMWDSVADIMHTNWELWVMTKLWAWVWTYFWNLRPRWTAITNNWESSGSVHFMEMFDKTASVISQGSQRRWATTPYLPVEHWDIEEFLEIGTEWHPIQRCTTAVTISNEWMKDMLEWNKENRKTRAKILKRRSEVGYPYITFVWNANEQRVDVYKDKWLEIKTSNICQEIFLNTDEKNSFVCCLSSINLLHRDEIKDTDAVETMVCFLDAVMQEFINKLESLRDSDKKEDNITFHFMEKAYNFALRERAIWVWVLGWHSYLQSKMIAIESVEASAINIDIWKVIKDKTYSASMWMADVYWEPSLLKWYWRRHSHLMAVAPTTSSAFILWQVSQSIEPLMSNYYTKNLAKHTATIKNIYLEQLLKEKKMSNRDVWDSIRDYDGSVQHLDFLTPEEKQVFKTFKEIDQDILLQQASDRQKYIDQWQSLNTMITPSMTAKDVSNLCIKAWELSLKWLYYAHSINAAQETVRSIKQASDIEKVCYIWCKSCEA